LQYQASAFHTGKRLSKIGRPTKKQRRDLDDFTELWSVHQWSNSWSEWHNRRWQKN